MTPPGNPWRRRTMLASGAAVLAAWVVGLPRLLVGGASDLSFRDLPDLPPFRILKTQGATSGSASLLIGLDDAGAAPVSEQDLRAEVLANPCAALFGTQADLRLPIAFFSDFHCPNCRALERAVSDHDARYPGTIRIIPHELPLLGPGSTLASQAVLAADLQGGYDALRGRLMRARMVTDLAYILTLADSAGLDGQRLLKDMHSPQVAAALARSRALAGLFGFYGTPATVIGRSAVIGAITPSDLGQIIEMERALPPLDCWAV